MPRSKPPALARPERRCCEPGRRTRSRPNLPPRTQLDTGKGRRTQGQHHTRPPPRSKTGPHRPDNPLHPRGRSRTGSPPDGPRSPHPGLPSMARTSRHQTPRCSSSQGRGRPRQAIRSGFDGVAPSLSLLPTVSHPTRQDAFVALAALPGHGRMLSADRTPENHRGRRRHRRVVRRQAVRIAPDSARSWYFGHEAGQPLGISSIPTERIRFTERKKSNGNGIPASGRP